MGPSLGTETEVEKSSSIFLPRFIFPSRAIFLSRSIFLSLNFSV